LGKCNSGSGLRHTKFCSGSGVGKTAGAPAELRLRQLRRTALLILLFLFFVEVNSLRLFIYDTATNLKKGRSHVMGELIPSSFISLIDRIEKRRTEIQEKHQLPIIRKEEFDAMVKENSLHCRRDIQELMDVRDATIFLRERGILFICLREVYWTAQSSPPPPLPK
jgi:hypothetical protein